MDGFVIEVLGASAAYDNLGRLCKDWHRILKRAQVDSSIRR